MGGGVDVGCGSSSDTFFYLVSKIQRVRGRRNKQLGAIRLFFRDFAMFYLLISLRLLLSLVLG